MTENPCYYSYYLYARSCKNGTYSAAVYRHFDDVIKSHPAQCVIDGTTYPAAWATENPFDNPFAIKIKVEHGKWIWLLDKCTHIKEFIIHVSVRAASEQENPRTFFIYISDRFDEVNIEVYRSLDDAILAHRPPTNNDKACWDSRKDGEWEINLGRSWQHDFGNQVEVIVETTLEEVVEVIRRR